MSGTFSKHRSADLIIKEATDVDLVLDWKVVIALVRTMSFPLYVTENLI